MPKQANGTERFEEEEEERHKVVPATETKPAPAANGARLRTTLMSTVGTRNDLTADHAISISLLKVETWNSDSCSNTTVKVY